MTKYLFLGILSVSLLINSCKPTQKPPLSSNVFFENGQNITPTSTEEVEEEIPNWVNPKGSYQPEKTRHFELIHTRLNLTPDWQKQQVKGEAVLSMRPYFYPQILVRLDAKGFDIEQVAMLSKKDTINLKFGYDSLKLNITLPQLFTRADTLRLYIRYTAKPNQLPKGLNDKGVYFINPSGEDPNKPRQIWTQGEAEAASCWFPTFDAPNVKSSQELYLTVDTAFVTVSNGRLLWQKKHANGTRTDAWLQQKPHAPYLFAFVVGQFVHVKDKWRDLDLGYYLEPKYAPYAKKIFGNTPKMLDFFSQKFDYQYPWDKYAQVVVRDFVAGAMENTSVSIFMEDLNGDERTLLDENWDGIIAHELFHHWFGNLVTCESWANLPLNESFANYGEYLWLEHQYGTEEADFHRLKELEGYLYEANSKREPLIRYHHNTPDDMFDAHSYNKGGLVLHILRKQVGDDAFFKSLSNYLKKNAFQKTEIHHLRQAFEETIGEDLNWFFDEWFLQAGHPELVVKDSYEEGKLTLRIFQKQLPKYTPIYRLPLAVDIWVAGKKTRHQILMNSLVDTLVFEATQKPDLVLFDAETLLPTDIDHIKTTEAFIYQYYHAEKIIARLEAIKQLKSGITDELPIQKVFLDALSDPFWAIREIAAQAFDGYQGSYKQEIIEKITFMALKDPKPMARTAALSTLASFGKDYLPTIEKALNDSAYSVVSMAMYAYLNLGGEKAEDKFQRFEKADNLAIISTLADFYSYQNIDGKFGWYQYQIERQGSETLRLLLRYLGQYLFRRSDAERKEGILLLEKMAIQHPDFQARMTAFQGLQLLTDTEGVKEKLQKIRQAEKHPSAKKIYEAIDLR